LTCTVIPCLYVFVEIRVDVQHLVDCVQLTFLEEEKGRQKDKVGEEKDSTPDGPTRIIETLVMGTVQFRSAVVESAQRLDASSLSSDSNSSSQYPVQFQAIVPQAKPLSPGEVLGCTAPSGLAAMNFQEALSKSRRRQARKSQDASANVENVIGDSITRERVMIFLADGRFHLEAAMISNPSIRALRYDPYSKTLTEERYEIVQMKRLRREAILSVRSILGVASPTQRLELVSGKVDNHSGAQSGDDIANSVLQKQPLHPQVPLQESSEPRTMGIILGTLGRQGNPAILSRIRSLLHSRGIRSIIVLLSEIFPKKLEMMSTTNPSSSHGKGKVCAWVQIACPRLSIDWGHYFCVPVLSPFELFVALGEVVDPSLWVANDSEETREKEEDGYPMDFYSKSGGPWANYYDSNKDRKVMSYGT
jgi:2-(3-amino-3-carboxypropyl)histidine synthase